MSDNLSSKEITVDKYQPIYYAGASGDFNPIHIDEDYAKKAGLGSVILHGLCTMAFAYKAVMENKDPSLLKKIQVRFRNVVRINDKLKIIYRVLEENNKTKSFDVTVENQNKDQVITNGLVVIEND